MEGTRVVHIFDTCSRARQLTHLLLLWHFSLKENNNLGFSTLYT